MPDPQVANAHRPLIALGALLAAAGVAAGAFGTHGLRDILGEQQLGWWQTAVQYQLWHALGILALAALPIPRARLSAGLLAAGILIFSGSLYLMALTDMRWLSAVTPLGGTALILGWLTLAWTALRHR